MDENSTTATADNQTDANANPADPNAATDAQTAANTNGTDNLETSTNTETNDGAANAAAGDDEGASAPTFDTDLDQWAEKTNRPVPTTDRERELYQEIRNGQREFSRGKQAKDASQSVNKAIEAAKPPAENDDELDDVEKRQDALEASLHEERSLRVRSEYFAEKSVTPEQSKVMGEILQEKVDKAATSAEKISAYKYWTNPNQLADWHDLAKARLTTTQDTTVIEQEAARKERERIAKESQATGASRNATNTGTQKPQGYNRNEFLKSDD